MTYRTKSFVYFASLVIALVIYCNMERADTTETTQLAENHHERFSTLEAL